MHILFALVFVCCVALSSTVLAADESPHVDDQLSRLKSPSAETRIAALRELQTSLDPRIPDAMIPLLSDDGNSIRRLAARAIGSRWWQISKERVPDFIQALKRNLATTYDDERNMVNRAIGLLNREYKGDMFARSANKRWVVYERHKLPCLIDTSNQSEELLGWSPEPENLNWLSATYGNDSLKDCVLWHPEEEMVAFDMVLHRHASTAWVWIHQKGLRELPITKVMDELDHHPSGPNFFHTTLKKWKDEELLIDISYDVKNAVIAWNPENNHIRIVSKKE